MYPTLAQSIDCQSNRCHVSSSKLHISVEQTSFAIESVRDTQTTIAAMQTASKQLKMEHKKIDIGAIEDMQDDLSGMGKSIHCNTNYQLI